MTTNRQDMNGAQMLPPINSHSINNNSNNNPNSNNNMNNANSNNQGYYLPRQYLKTIPIVANNNGFVISNTLRKNYIPPNSLPALASKTNNNNNLAQQGIVTVAGPGALGVQSEQWSKPRLITIIRATERPRKRITILLNRKALHSFEQFVCDISDAFGLPQWKNDKIRKLYSIKGKRIQGISEFFREEDIFIGVSGKEPLKGHLVKDLIQEIYPDNEEFAQSIFKEWESSRSKSRAKPRHNSVDHVNNNNNNSNNNNLAQGAGVYSNQLTNRNNNNNLNNVEFDENGRRKRKKKVNDSDNVIVDMETQRQRERLKLIEMERKKRELNSLQKINEKDSNNNNVNQPNTSTNNKYVNRKVNVLAPITSNENHSNNNNNELAIDTRKVRRKPKFKKSLNDVIIDEPEPSENIKQSKPKTPVNTKDISPIIFEEEINNINNVTPVNNHHTPRHVNNKSKSPAIPKENKESRRDSLNDNKEYHQRPSPNNLVPPPPVNEKNNNEANAKNRKQSQPNATPRSNKLRRQVFYIHFFKIIFIKYLKHDILSIIDIKCITCYR